MKTVNDLTPQQLSEVKRAIRSAAEYIYSDVLASAEASGEQLKNADFIDGVIDGLTSYAQVPLSPDTLKVWQSIPYAARLRWASREFQYV